MTEPRLDHVQCLDGRGLHRMAYWEWGDAANPRVLVCVHGLSRQGRDFDTLAQALCQDYRVVCPDVVGRGRSDWLVDPSGYQIPAYVSDMVTLLARLRAAELHWVGTSMGGLIGLGLAALKDSPIRRLVLNDVGPTIQADALQRIGAYLGEPQHWAPRHRLQASLRPGDRRALPRDHTADRPGRRGHALAQLRRDSLPDAAVAGGAVRPAVARNGRGHDAAGTEGAAA
jgi:pimeloyl-ACP methyl ester carboxylesterase